MSSEEGVRVAAPNRFVERLRDGPPIVGDGGMGALVTSAVPRLRTPEEAHLRALTLAEPGDLVLLFADALTRTWKQVINFKPDTAPVRAPDRVRAAVPLPVPDLPAVEVPSLNGDALVRDERGVRLARETED